MGGPDDGGALQTLDDQDMLFFEVARVRASDAMRKPSSAPGKTGAASKSERGSESSGLGTSSLDRLTFELDVREYLSAHLFFRIKAVLADPTIAAAAAATTSSSSPPLADDAMSETTTSETLSVSQKDVNKLIAAQSSSKWTTTKIPCRVPSKFVVVREFPFFGSFDKNGVLYNLATSGGRKDYANPHLGRIVVATMSSRGHEACAPHKFVSHGGEGANFTNNEINAWMCVDLGPHRKLGAAFSLFDVQCPFEFPLLTGFDFIHSA